MAGRVTHIKRIYKDHDPNSDIWIDVERIDEVTVIVSGRQERTYQFDWDSIESNPRAHSHKTISNPNDASSAIDVPIRHNFDMEFPKAVYHFTFNNGASNRSRRTHSRRIYHHDIKGAYLENGGPPRDSETYLKSLGNQDPQQFVDVEVVDAHLSAGDDNYNFYQHSAILHAGGARDSQTVRGQERQWDGTTTDPLVVDPLVAGDTAGGTPGFIFLKNPAAGVVIDPPWRLDPLQNIVNVSWGLIGTFVCGDGGGYTQVIDVNALLRLINPDLGESTGWQNLGQMAFAPNGAVNGSSYQKLTIAGEEGEIEVPTWVLVGEDNAGSVNETAAKGIIMTSGDGKTWTKTYTVDLPGDPFDPHTRCRSTVLGVVWNAQEQKFYAGAAAELDEFIGGGDDPIRPLRETFWDILLKSNDGVSWEEEIRTKIPGAEFNPDGTLILPLPDVYDGDYKGALVDKCSDSAELGMIDANGHAVPDGYYGFWQPSPDSLESLLVAPAEMPTIRYGLGQRGRGTIAAVYIRRTDANGEETEETGSVGFPVSAVANSGDKRIWIATGNADSFGMVAAWDDTNQTWKTVLEASGQPIWTAIGGKGPKQPADSGEGGDGGDGGDGGG